MRGTSDGCFGGSECVFQTGRSVGTPTVRRLYHTCWMTETFYQSLEACPSVSCARVRVCLLYLCVCSHVMLLFIVHYIFRHGIYIYSFISTASLYQQVKNRQRCPGLQTRTPGRFGRESCRRLLCALLSVHVVWTCCGLSLKIRACAYITTTVNSFFLYIDIAPRWGNGENTTRLGYLTWFMCHRFFFECISSTYTHTNTHASALSARNKKTLRNFPGVWWSSLNYSVLKEATGTIHRISKSAIGVDFKVKAMNE